MNKILICYFSATGTTKNAAEQISLATNVELFEIEPVEKYTNKDLDWNDKNSRTTLEMKNENCRPKIVKKIENINNYDKIVIGFPVWWYREPSIIDTFIEENNLKEKSIYIFVTSGGSTVNDSLESLKKHYKDLNFISGKTLNYNIEEKDIKDWLM